MRLRALLTSTCLAATAVLAALPGAAIAVPPTATPTLVRVVYGGTAPFTGLDLTTCVGPNTGSAAIVSQASGTFGTGALRMALGSNAESDPLLYKDYGATPPLAEDFDLSYDLLKQGTAAAATPLLDITVDGDGDPSTLADIKDLLYALGPDSTTVWRHAAPLAGGTFEDGSTWAAYKAANPSAKVLGFSLDVGCGDPLSGAGSIALIDNLVMNTGASTAATFDFEPASSIAASGAGTIVAGAARVVSGVLKSGTTPIVGAPVSVWARTYPSTTYSKIATVTTDGTGKATYNAKPSVQTTYQLRYAGSEPTNGAANSGLLVVNVATKITKNVYDTTVTTTQPVQVYGLTLPAKPGTYVYLYRGSVKIATARVASDGTYLLQARITTKGKHVLKVLGAAGTGNLAGTSAASYVTVS